ncbi:MAG: tetratricopeptide repeat protein [Spirochaetaceae bacterium]|jgi:tetratricopeptide (TPR) repeat protein|nr:tetratricopeptide repeat protein [Spirochaetaceae bacterium]
MKTTYDEAVKLFKMKRWDSALATFQEAETSTFNAEQKAELAYYFGLCYTKLERFNDALVYLEQFVSDDKRSLRSCQCRLTLAYIYMNTKRPKMAEFELEHLLKSGFKSAQIYTMLGFAAWTQNQEKEAIERYEKALELDLNNSTALNSLGYILVETGKDIPRGLELCKRAVEKHPGSAVYMDSLGWAYYKSGELVEARTWLRRALSIAPRQREISGHMKALVDKAS